MIMFGELERIQRKLLECVPMHHKDMRPEELISKSDHSLNWTLLGYKQDDALLHRQTKLEVVSRRSSHLE
jgi:hypothetical protein